MNCCGIIVSGRAGKGGWSCKVYTAVTRNSRADEGYRECEAYTCH